MGPLSSHSLPWAGTRRGLLAGALAWPVVATAQTPAAWRPESLMPAFWAAYDAAPVEGRAEALWARFFEPNLAVYNQAGARIELRHVIRPNSRP